MQLDVDAAQGMYTKLRPLITALAWAVGLVSVHIGQLGGMMNNN